MDFKLGKENKLKKRANLAPLPKRESPDREIADESEDDFTEEQLADLFNAVEKETVPKKAMIDLDDWVPPALKTSPAVKIEEKEPLKSLNQMLVKDKAPAFRNRTDMLFSSIEFEADTTLGLRFSKRKIPATDLKELNKTSEKVALYDAIKSCIKKDWFTYGVVSDFSEMRKSGGARIDVTNLSAEPYILRCLIFNGAFTGKIDIGSIVCILNPSKAKPYNGREAIAINNANQLVVAGTSRDFSLCSGKKKDGGTCKNVVNLHLCRYCKYHAISEYKNQKVGKDVQAAAKGAGLPSTSKRPSANSWNNKPAFKPLAPAKKNLAQIKKDQERLEKLCSSGTTSEKKTYDRFEKSSAPATIIKKIEYEKVNSPVIEKRKCQEMEESPAAKKPCIVLPPITHRMSAAKRKALEYAKQNGGIANQKPSKKPIEEESKPADPATPIHLSKKFLEMMKENPRDAALANDAETIERNKKFDRLEIVEEISEKLAATHEVPVRAIRCLVCKKNYHQMPLQCVMNKHKCKVVTGTKRFFECNGCRSKTTTLEIVPIAECGKCGVWSWKRSGVAKNRVCNAAPQLSVRGFEETFVNSVVKDPNLNLLIPDNQ